LLSRLLGTAVLVVCPTLLLAAIPPLVCPAGGPIGSVELRVASPHTGNEPLPLRTINRLEEGDTLLYRPLLRSGEERKGEVAIVLVPANKTAPLGKLAILDPKPADRPQQWKVPWRVAVVAYVYGPSGLNAKKVKDFLSRDDDLVAQLADYAEKTAQTEALIAALSAPAGSALNVQSALQAFSSQYGVNTQLDRNAPTNQQALSIFRAVNPSIASYDPLSPQASQPLGQAAGLATTVATLFFGSPVGLAAGGTAMLLELRSIAFPGAQFRSSFSQTMPDDGLGLCGKRDAIPRHTRVAYIWASRVPNVGPPQLSVGKAHSLPPGMKSTVSLSGAEADWKYIDRARNWVLQPENGKAVPIKVQRLDAKTLELNLGPTVTAGKYTLMANWDWDRFPVAGHIEVKPLSDFASAKLMAASQDLLVAKTGKVPLILEGSDFEFVTKVEIEKVNDKFSAPDRVPFVLSQGLREGPQEHLDIQVNTVDLDAGQYKLLIYQVDGKEHPVSLKILPSPPHIENLPVVLNQGMSAVAFNLKGERLDLLKRLEVANGSAELGAETPNQTERKLLLHMAPEIDAGTSLAMKAYIKDRSEPLTLADAVRIVGPRPKITELKIYQPPKQDVQLEDGELPGGLYLSALIRVQHLQSNSVVKLGCERAGGVELSLHLGERAGPVSLQQLAPDQVFLSFDSGVWLNGCFLEARVANGSEGESEAFKLGRIVRVPEIEQLKVGTDSVSGSLIGQNLETIEKTGWSADQEEAVDGLPLPAPGEGQKQTLQIRVPSPPDRHAQLYVWLRGESKPRPTKIHP